MNILKKKLTKEETLISYLAGNFSEDCKSGKIAKNKEILKLVCETFSGDLILDYSCEVYGPCELIEEALKQRGSDYLEEYEIFNTLKETAIWM